MRVLEWLQAVGKGQEPQSEQMYKLLMGAIGFFLAICCFLMGYWWGSR